MVFIILLLKEDINYKFKSEMILMKMLKKKFSKKLIYYLLMLDISMFHGLTETSVLIIFLKFSLKMDLTPFPPTLMELMLEE